MLAAIVNMVAKEMGEEEFLSKNVTMDEIREMRKYLNLNKKYQ